MFDLSILFASVLNGITTGAVYALIALGLTLIYGVLHIINFAHGASLMVALYGVYFLKEKIGLDPYLTLPIVVPAVTMIANITTTPELIPTNTSPRIADNSARCTVVSPSR